MKITTQKVRISNNKAIVMKAGFEPGRYPHRKGLVLKTPGPYFKFEVPHISSSGSNSHCEK
jgi:hypothetical protein